MQAVAVRHGRWRPRWRRDPRGLRRRRGCLLGLAHGDPRALASTGAAHHGRRRRR
ncbi:hypothetical protein QJS66_19120 [Kocuria rhizophila]|nr:hypothetical protein QJS66_19120 [Kocuria rhizophila]